MFQELFQMQIRYELFLIHSPCKSVLSLFQDCKCRIFNIYLCLYSLNKPYIRFKHWTCLSHSSYLVTFEIKWLSFLKPKVKTEDPGMRYDLNLPPWKSKQIWVSTAVARHNFLDQKIGTSRNIVILYVNLILFIIQQWQWIGT